MIRYSLQVHTPLLLSSIITLPQNTHGQQRKNGLLGKGSVALGMWTQVTTFAASVNLIHSHDTTKCLPAPTNGENNCLTSEPQTIP